MPVNGTSEIMAGASREVKKAEKIAAAKTELIEAIDELEAATKRHARAKLALEKLTKPKEKG